VSSTGQDGPAILVRDVSKRYGRTVALNHIDLEVARGEFAVLAGPAGAGKSTLLNLLAALEKPDTGTIEVGGHKLGRHGRHLNHLRRVEVGLVFQLHNLIPRLTARENIEAAMFGTHHSRKQRVARATELLERLDLAHRAGDRPPTMSGGERQRVAVARALANEPGVILADEPTGSLDDESADLVLDLFDELKDRGSTILAVSHDNRLDARGDRVLSITDLNCVER
jgi:putative ABC transport system ATP-binding protein